MLFSRFYLEFCYFLKRKTIIKSQIILGLNLLLRPASILNSAQPFPRPISFFQPSRRPFPFSSAPKSPAGRSFCAAAWPARFPAQHRAAPSLFLQRGRPTRPGSPARPFSREAQPRPAFLSLRAAQTEVQPSQCPAFSFVTLPRGPTANFHGSFVFNLVSSSHAESCSSTYAPPASSWTPPYGGFKRSPSASK